MNTAYLHVYTGNGKGKTTAAIGLAIRALGAGMSVYFGQFIKGMRYSEIQILETLAGVLGEGRLHIQQYGRGCFIRRDPEQADVDAARQGLKEAEAALASALYGLVILDELNVAIKTGLIREDEALSVIRARPAQVELVITGRYAPASILAEADLVTEMREVKHYYQRGVEARNGIER